MTFEQDEDIPSVEVEATVELPVWEDDEAQGEPNEEPDKKLGDIVPSEVVDPKAIAVVAPPVNKQLQDQRALYNQAKILAGSKIIPSTLIGKPSDIYVILCQGYELGIGAMQSLNGIECIKGRPTVKPELALGLLRSKLPYFRMELKKDESKKSVTCKMWRDHRDKDAFSDSTWNQARADKMGIGHKENYQKQAMTMFKWRSVGDCAKEIGSDILRGLYIVEELLDIDDQTYGTPEPPKSAQLNQLIDNEPSGVEVE